MTDDLKTPERIWARLSVNSKNKTVVLLGHAHFDLSGWQEYVRADLADPAAIREAALREAAEVAQRGADILGGRMRNAKDKKEKRDWQSMLFAAVDIKHAILALIGETK